MHRRYGLGKIVGCHERTKEPSGGYKGRSVKVSVSRRISPSISPTHRSRYHHSDCNTLPQHTSCGFPLDLSTPSFPPIEFRYFPAISRCFPLFPAISRYFPLLPAASRCIPLPWTSPHRYPARPIPHPPRPTLLLTVPLRTAWSGAVSPSPSPIMLRRSPSTSSRTHLAQRDLVMWLP